MEPPEDHSFIPANDKLISVFLRRRVAGEPLPPATAAHFHDADIYSADPATLTTGFQPVPAVKGEASSWFFFTPLRSKSSTDSRKSRQVGGGVGTWHSEHAPEAVVDDDGNRVGNRQLFSYKEKGGKRSGWSMWEFIAADHGGGEPVLVLCKIHQTHANSRRKRKCTDDDQARSPAPVRRRLFAASPAPTPLAASQDEVASASEAIPCSRTEIEASNDTPTSVPIILNEPDPITSQDEIGPASEAIPNSMSEKEASKDTPRSVLSFWDESATFQEMMGASLMPDRSFLANPDTRESSASFLIADTAASQGVGTAAFDCGFLTNGGTLPAPEHCYHETFTDSSGGDMSGHPLHAPGVGISGSWTEYDAMGSFFSENAFLGLEGLPTYDDDGAGGSCSWTGYNTGTIAPSWPVSNAFIGAHNESGISGYAGVPSGCGVPSATIPSQWGCGPGIWGC